MPTQERSGENPFSLAYKSSETDFEQELENEFDHEIRVQFDRRFENNKSQSSQISESTITESQNQSVPSSQIRRDGYGNVEVSSSEVSSSQVPSSQVPTSQVPSSEVPSSQVPGLKVPSSHVLNSQVPNSQIPSSQVPRPEIPNYGTVNSQVPDSRISSKKYTTYKPTFIQPRPSTLQNDQNLKKYNWRVLSLEASDTDGEKSPLPESRSQTQVSQRKIQNFPKKPEEPVIEFSESRSANLDSRLEPRPDIDIAKIWQKTNHSQPLSTNFLKEVTTKDCKTLLRIYDMLKVSNTRELELKIAILLKNRDSLQSKLNIENRDCEDFRRENNDLRKDNDDLADVVESKRKKYEKLEDEWFDLRDDTEDLEQALGDAVKRLKRYEGKTSVGEFYYQGLAKRRKPESRRGSPEDYRKSESASKKQRNHLDSIGDSYDSDRMKFNKKWEKYPETAVDRQANERKTISQNMSQNISQQEIFKIDSKSENNEKCYVRSSPKICSKEKQFLGDYLRKTSKKDVTKAFSENKPVDSDKLISNYVRSNEKTNEKQQSSDDEKPISIQTFELQNITKNIVNNINTTNSTPKLSDLTGAHNKTINEIPLNIEIKLLAEIEKSQKFTPEIESVVTGELKNIQEKYLKGGNSKGGNSKEGNSKGESSKAPNIKVKEKVFSVLSEVGGKKCGYEYRVKLSDCEAVGQGRNRSVAKGYAYLMFLWKLKKRLGIFDGEDVPEVGSFTLDIDNF